MLTFVNLIVMTMRMMMIMTMNMLRMGRAQLSIKADVVCGDSKAWPREIKRDAHRVDLHKMRKHRNVILVDILLTTKCKSLFSNWFYFEVNVRNDSNIRRFGRKIKNGKYCHISGFLIGEPFSSLRGECFW